jgi:hypothetical protein
MEYELKLEEREINLVLTGLSRLAYIDSAELIGKIKRSCVQSKPKEPIEEDE